MKFRAALVSWVLVAGAAAQQPGAVARRPEVAAQKPAAVAQKTGMAAAAQNAAIRTIQQANSFPTGFPPRGGSWSPDSRLFSFVATDDRTGGRPGDIIAIDALTGKASVLATRAQLSALPAPPISEKDRDHRDRYSMSSYLWADDSQHLVIDNGGPIYLWDIRTATGKLIVDTHTASGADPKFSPDARSVSYLRGHNLYVHSIAGNSETALTSGPASTLNGEVDWVYLEELEVRSNYFWAPDSAHLAYLEMDEAKVPLYPIVDYIPTHATVDEQRFPQPGDPNPAVRVGVVPATGGATRFVEVPFSRGNDYIPRFGWVDANTVYVEVLTRDQQHLNLYFADIATGRTKLVHSESDAKYLEDNYDVTFVTPAAGAPGRFFFTSWKDGHTHLYLYRFDASHPLEAEAVLDRQLTRGDYEVTAPEVRGARMFYTSTEPAVADSALYSAGLDGQDKQRLTPAAGAHDATVSPDGKAFFDIASDERTPPTASLCRVGGATCSIVWRANPLVAATGVTTSRVTLLAADGKTPLYGTLTVPTQATKGSVPLILNPYGGPLPSVELKNSWSYGAIFDELLAQHGFAVLHVENRGQGGRGRAFSQANYRNFGPVQFSDQMAALDQVLAQTPMLDPRRVGWWGWSWGGTFTLFAMTHTDRIRAGVAVAPNGDFRDYDTIYTERYLGLPAENAAAYDAASNVLHARDLKGRILLAQGTGDDNVHMANTIQVLEPLIEAGIPYDLQLFPRKTHSIAGIAARNELYQRILAHFETWLK